MAALNPIYRLTLYAPRSVDPAEATVLVPAAGAPHADAFRVASAQGLAGWAPYLNAPRGRQGRLDPLTKQTDTGTLSVSLIDGRVDGAQLKRWVTAFVGDGAGLSQLKGCRALLELSTDGGGAWAAYFTGRVRSARLSGRAVVELGLRDLADDLQAQLFQGAPVGDAESYAHQAQVYPLGLLRPYGDFPVTEPARGTVAVSYVTPFNGSQTGLLSLEPDLTHGAAKRFLATPALERATRTEHRLYLRAVGASEWSVYRFNAAIRFDYERRRYRSSPRRIAGETLPADDATPGKATPAELPAEGAQVEFYVARVRGAPRAQEPLLIGDVHPVTLWRHVLEGLYSAGAQGVVRPLAAYDAAAFAALEADGSFPTVRFQVVKAEKAADWVERQLLQPFGLGYVLDASGRVVPIDLRTRADAQPDATLTDADLVAGEAPTWVDDSEGAVRRVSAQFVGERWLDDGALPLPGIDVDRSELPDIAPVRLTEDDGYSVTLADFGPRSLDVEGGELSLEARGLRFRQGAAAADSEEVADDAAALTRRRVVEDYLAGVAADLRAPYALGPVSVELACLRTATALSIRPGHRVVLAVSALPDPATNERGTGRVGLCTGRVEDGPTLRLSFVDVGDAAQAEVPTVATPTVGADPTEVRALVSANAAGDPVQLQYIVTPTATAVRPGDSALWLTLDAQLAGGTTAVLADMPRGVRVWVRARSMPGAGRGFRVPSPWAHPAGTGYVDTTGQAALQALALAVSADGRPTLTWTPAAGTAGLRLRLALHLATQAPGYGAAVDVDASAGSYTWADVFVHSGVRATVEAVAYPGWIGSAVSGTAGAAHLAEFDRPVDAASYVVRAEVVGVTNEAVTYALEVGALVEELHVYDRALATPLAPGVEPYPAPGWVGDVVHLVEYPALTFEHAVAVPANGFQRFAEFEARAPDADGRIVAQSEGVQVVVNALSANTPGVRPRVERASSGAVADVYLDGFSPIGEGVGFRLELDGTLYTLVTGNGSTTPLYLAAAEGVEEAGPLNWWHDGAGGWAQVLGDIPLVRDQLQRLVVQAVGQVSQLRSTWVVVPLESKAQAWLEAAAIAWDEGDDRLHVTIRGGALVQQVGVEVFPAGDPNAALLDSAYNLVDGQQLELDTRALVVGERRQRFRLVATPYNAGGAAGVPMEAEAFVPADPGIQVAEQPRQAAGYGILRLVITDPEARVTAVHFKTAAGGGAIDFTDPGNAAAGWVQDTVQPYEGTVALVAKHNSTVGYAVAYTDHDGTTRWITGAHPFDLDVEAEAVIGAVSFNASGNPIVSLRGDEDTTGIFLKGSTSAYDEAPPAVPATPTLAARTGDVTLTGLVVPENGDVYLTAWGYNSTTQRLGPIAKSRVRRGVETAQVNTAVLITGAGWEGGFAGTLQDFSIVLSLDYGKDVRSIGINYGPVGAPGPSGNYTFDVAAGGGAVNHVVQVSQANTTAQVWPADYDDTVRITVTSYPQTGGQGTGGVSRTKDVGPPHAVGVGTVLAKAGATLSLARVTLGNGVRLTADGFDVVPPVGAVGTVSGSYTPNFTDTGELHVVASGAITLQMPTGLVNGSTHLLWLDMGAHALNFQPNTFWWPDGARKDGLTGRCLVTLAVRGDGGSREVWASATGGGAKA